MTQDIHWPGSNVYPSDRFGGQWIETYCYPFTQASDDVTILGTADVLDVIDVVIYI